MTTSINITADNVPAICILFGAILILSAYSLDHLGMLGGGWALAIMGGALQVLWLLKK